MTEPDPNPYTMLEAKIRGLQKQVGRVYAHLSEVDDITPLTHNGVLSPILQNVHVALHNLDLAGDRVLDLAIEETKRREIVSTAIDFLEEEGK